MKKKPYILITSLLSILFFILGVRYGQYIEKINKKIDFISSISPSPVKSPIPIPTTEYKSKRWGLKFKYPQNLKIVESTKSAEIFIFEEKNK